MLRPNQKGFAHWIIPVIVIVLVALVGLRTLLGSHAASAVHPVIWGGNTAHPQYGPSGFNGVEEQAGQLGRKLASRFYVNYPSGCLKSQNCVSGAYSPAFAPGTEEYQLFAGGRIVALSVSNGYPVANVVNGASTKGNSGNTIDEEYKALFDRMLNLPFGVGGNPNEVWFIYEHEMNAGGVDAGNFKSAWIHLHSLYEGERARLGKPERVKFVFTPTHALYNYGNVATWWPGDQYVDIVGSDLYNDSTKAGHSFQSFAKMYEGNGGPNSLPVWASAHGQKPVAFLEIGTRNDDAQSKQWWIDLGNYVKTHTEIVGVLPFTGGSGWGISQAKFPLQHAGVLQAIQTTQGNAVSYSGGVTNGTSFTVSSVTPANGPATGGTVITIKIANTPVGTGAGPQVTIGGVAATHVNRVGSTITATTPAHAAGAATVSVTIGGVTATSANGFSYNGTTPTPPPPSSDGWTMVYQNNFATATEMRDVNAFGSPADKNNPLKPSDTNLQQLKLPSVKANTVQENDPGAQDGKALMVYDRPGTYPTSKGPQQGWTTGRFAIKGHNQTTPVRIETRLRMTRSIANKSAVMFWPATGGWKWEVDFVETSGGLSTSSGNGSRQSIAVNFHKDLNGDGQAKEQKHFSYNVDATQYHVYDVYILPNHMWVTVDGHLAADMTDTRYIPSGTGFFTVGKALTGAPRSYPNRTNDVVALDWVKFFKPTTKTANTTIASAADLTTLTEPDRPDNSEPPLSGPRNVTAQRINASTAKLSWLTPTQPGAYGLTYSVQRDGVTVADDITELSTTVSAPSTEKHNFSVTVTDTDGNTATSNTAVVPTRVANCSVWQISHWTFHLGIVPKPCSK